MAVSFSFLPQIALAASPKSDGSSSDTPSLSVAQSAPFEAHEQQAGSRRFALMGDLMIQLRRKITDDPYDENLRLRLASYLYLAGDLEGSASEMKRAVAIAPEDYFAHMVLAKILDHSGDEANAELEFKRAMQLKPGSAESHEYYADSLSGLRFLRLLANTALLLSSNQAPVTFLACPKPFWRPTILVAQSRRLAGRFELSPARPELMWF